MDFSGTDGGDRIVRRRGHVDAHLPFRSHQTRAQSERTAPSASVIQQMDRWSQMVLRIQKKCLQRTHEVIVD